MKGFRELPRGDLKQDTGIFILPLQRAQPWYSEGYLGQKSH